MKILFITGGLTTLRRKSNSYQETLMEKIASRGHQVTVLCMAEVSLRPWIHWKKSVEKIEIYHLYNGGVYPGVYPQGGVGTRSPLLEVKPSHKLRKIVFQIIQEVSPDLISFQSLFGLPLELLQEIAEGKIPTQLTALDYFSLCPTAHLFPSDQKPCRLTTAELTCNDCCQNTVHYSTFWITYHLDQWVASLQKNSLLYSPLCRLRNLFLRFNRFWNRHQAPSPSYSLRRKAAIRALRSLTLIHCISQLQADLFQQLAGALPSLQVLHAHPASTEKIEPQKALYRSSSPLKFIALNVHAPYKGLNLLHSTFDQLQKEGFQFELHFYGSIPDHILHSPLVHYHGRYQETDLDQIASEADFCLIPSLWDETLGFVGLEMLSRGVPLIVSQCAGISEFVKDRETGMLFNSADSESLLNILREILQNKPLRERIFQNILIKDPKLKTFDQHTDEMEKLFMHLIEKRERL